MSDPVKAIAPKKRRPKKTSPTQRSLALMRERGCIAEVVEHWNPHAMIRVDLFNVIDIVALSSSAIIGVQTTTTKNMGARRAKIIAEPAIARWLQAGGRIHLHGWAKKGPRGGRKTWQVTEEEIVMGQTADTNGNLYVEADLSKVGT